MMSVLPELKFDEIFNYCFFRGRADVAFNKDRDSDIFVVRYEFPLTEPRRQRKYLWILYHPSSFKPIDSIIKKIEEAVKSNIIRIVDKETDELSMVWVFCRKWFKEYVIKYEVSSSRILLPGDIIARSTTNIIDYIKIRATGLLEGREYQGYFAVFSNYILDKESLKNQPLSLFHVLLILGANRVVSALNLVTTPSVYEVIKREIMEDFHELMTLKFTMFAVEILKKLGETFAKEAQQK